MRTNLLPNGVHEELFYQIALTFVPGIGTRTGRVLLDKLGSAKAIFETPLKQLKNIDGIGEVRAKGFSHPEVLTRAEKELQFIAKNNITVIYKDQGYPERLSNCVDAPLVLYCKGNADLNAARIVAIVGTRKNTDYGHRLCEELVDGLKGLDNMIIVSGLALGIDAIAHKRCLQQGIPTIGVFGHGLDRVYPFTHKQLSEQMVAHGGLLTEFPSETQPDRNNFPMRNRVVAGMSDITVVVESHIEGGALITARMAAGYHREVAAYPGRVTDTRSAGCNELIKTNIAAMITTPQDVIDMMNWGSDQKPRAVQQQLFVNFSPDEQKIIGLLQQRDAVHTDELQYHTGIPGSMLAATLLQLEMNNFIKALPGKYYRMQ